VGLELNGTHQRLAYADGVNLLGDNLDTINKNTDTLIDASKEVGIEVNVGNLYVVVLLPECRLISGYKNRKQII
jgi:hypothetical protein